MTIDNATMNGWISTHSGRKFWPLDPRPQDVFIDDIAHALSRQNRYTGHTRYDYCVLQHSCLVHDNVSQEFKKVALLHDATEAYLPDVARPIKSGIPGFGSIEAKLWNVIALVFGLPITIPDEVKRVDTRILLDEAEVLLPAGTTALWEDIWPPLGIDIVPWQRDYAIDQFWSRFNKLF